MTVFVMSVLASLFQLCLQFLCLSGWVCLIRLTCFFL